MLWADLVLVMDNGQNKRIIEKFRHFYSALFENLNIPYDYEYQDRELIELLENKINAIQQLNL